MLVLKSCGNLPPTFCTAMGNLFIALVTKSSPYSYQYQNEVDFEDCILNHGCRINCTEENLTDLLTDVSKYCDGLVVDVSNPFAAIDFMRRKILSKKISDECALALLDVILCLRCR